MCVTGLLSLGLLWALEIGTVGMGVTGSVPDRTRFLPAALQSPQLPSSVITSCVRKAMDPGGCLQP